MQKWKLINTKNILKNQWSQVDHLDFEIKGEVFTDFLRVHKKDFVMILAFTEDQELILIREYAWSADTIITGIPTGQINEGEDPAEAAIRELQEETGYKGEKAELWGWYYTDPKALTYKGYVCFVPNCKKVESQNLDRGEDIEVLLKSFDELKQEILSGEIKDSKIMSAILLYILKNTNDKS